MAYLVQPSRRRNTTCSDPIPTAVVAPVLKRVIEQYEIWKIDTIYTSAIPRETAGTHIISELVAAKSGGKVDTWARKLHRILKCEYQSCSITDVDHFLVAMGAHHLWYEPPLVDWYFDPAVIGEAA